MHMCCRDAVLLSSSTLVFLQTDSILASVWLAYMAANVERRLASMSQARAAPAGAVTRTDA